jgi:hypothetical protein
MAGIGIRVMDLVALAAARRHGCSFLTAKMGLEAGFSPPPWRSAGRSAPPPWPSRAWWRRSSPRSCGRTAVSSACRTTAGRAAHPRMAEQAAGACARRGDPSRPGRSGSGDRTWAERATRDGRWRASSPPRRGGSAPKEPGRSRSAQALWTLPGVRQGHGLVRAEVVGWPGSRSRRLGIRGETAVTAAAERSARPRPPRLANDPG